jgi:RNA polymerase sigma-70 factor, ECF subfamily
VILKYRMTDSSQTDTDQLLRQVADGCTRAVDQLLARHRRQLRRMIGVRMDGRVAARVDASDVVQETLMEAARQLPEYLEQRPLPFYPWLRQIAWKRLERLHQRHVVAQRRSVTREQERPIMLSDRSLSPLARRLLSRGATPSRAAVNEEARQRVRQALEQLGERDREVLVLRFLEQMSAAEIAVVLAIPEGTVRVRQLRALQRLQSLLSDMNEEPR